MFDFRLIAELKHEFRHGVLDGLLRSKAVFAVAETDSWPLVSESLHLHGRNELAARVIQIHPIPYACQEMR